jgi:hypothetical protein
LANRRSIIADQLDAGAGGVSVSIDATARMIQVARKKRGNQTKLYMSSANVLSFALPKNLCCAPLSKESNYWGFHFQRLKKLGGLK